MDKEDATMFQSVLGSMKRESWMGALMKRNELVHKSKRKVGGYAEIYIIRVGMRFAYHGISRIQGPKKNDFHDVEDVLGVNNYP
ncbi:unnamed protein product [Prunus brigantina]